MSGLLLSMSGCDLLRSFSELLHYSSSFGLAGGVNFSCILFIVSISMVCSEPDNMIPTSPPPLLSHDDLIFLIFLIFFSLLSFYSSLTMSSRCPSIESLDLENWLPLLKFICIYFWLVVGECILWFILIGVARMMLPLAPAIVVVLEGD